ncbi:MinD/ParA family ATP-binding protein [Candidatus Rhodoluna planktonica]|uniref:MinD/ParA family ATP-binding protein n=1 Tax=Candidatus Rhodoluna planktonica TaxID=535712 RepID=UPI003AAC43D9
MWGKKPEDHADDFLAPRAAEVEQPVRTHSLAEVAVDAGTVDVSPGTSSIEVVTEAPIVSEVEPRVEPEVAKRSNYSRRDSLRGEVFDQPEPAAMLTADRLLDSSARNRPAPESGFRRFIYFASLKTINPGDSLKVRERKALDARISANLEGGAKFVPVLTRKGGVGKTTVSTLLGMALALSREDRVIAIDANPDRGTLAERVSKSTRFTVRDVVNRAAAIDGFTDFSTMVSRDVTRLDVLASDSDPMLSEAFDEGDYNVVADMAARYYSIVLTDCGTGIVHSVMRPTLQRASGLVIVSGGSVDEARLASETLTWLEANGYGDLVRNSIVALNTATQATELVKLDEIEQHFRTRVRDVVRIPYDPALAAGSIIKFKDLKRGTQEAARELAALVVDGLNDPI